MSVLNREVSPSRRLKECIGKSSFRARKLVLYILTSKVSPSTVNVHALLDISDHCCVHEVSADIHGIRLPNRNQECEECAFTR